MKKKTKNKKLKKKRKKLSLNMWGKHCNQTKIMQGKDCSNP